MIRSNGELCHNIVEYEEVNKDMVGEPGVIWNGTCYARIVNKEWRRIDYTGDLEIKTQIIAPKTDADVKVNFKFKNGYVVESEPTVILIDNTSRLEHSEKIKKIAIQRAKKMNSLQYKIYKFMLINPLINICIYLRFPLIFLQELLIKLEQKIKKKL